MPCCPNPTTPMSDERLQLPDLIPTEYRLKDRDRITCQFVFHHEHHGRDALSVDAQYDAFLENVEQPYIRHIHLTEEWTAETFGWVKRPGEVILKNHAPLFRGVQPTEEERRAAARRSVLVCLDRIKDKHDWSVSPGRFSVVEINTPRTLYLRCVEGTIETTLHVIPR